MRNRKSGVHRHIYPLFLAVSATAMCWNRDASAQTYSWNTGTNDWSVGGSWTPSGPPTNGSTVNIIDADATNRTIFYDYPAPSTLTLANLTINNTGGGTNTLNWATSYTLQSLEESIGDSNTAGSPGRGAVVQNGGTNAVTNALYLGSYDDDIGVYALSGGELTIVSASGTENVGNGGTATFIQSAGVNDLSAGGSLYLANIGGSGTYSLSGTGMLNVGGNDYIGDSGSGTFIQSGGTHTTNGIMNLGYNAGATGSYVLSGGTLNFTTIIVGVNGSGTFTQSAGTVTSSFFDPILYVGAYSGSAGVYNLSGGTVGAEVASIGNEDASGTLAAATGTFNQSGGSASFTGLQVGQGGVGAYNLSGNGVLNAGVAGEFVGETGGVAPGTGIFTQIGGTNIDGGALVVGYGTGSHGGYSLSGNGTLSASNEYIGEDGGFGTFTQNNNGYANSVVAGGSLILGEFVGGGLYTLNSGAITSSGAITEIVGDYDASGTFDQTGGFNIGGSASAALYVGYSASATGTYNLSGGFLNIGTSSLGAYVGYSGTGTFTQSAGTANFTGSDSNGNSLSIGDQTGGNGVYVLSAGNLNVTNDEQVGNNGTGSFTQTGGDNSISQALFVGGPSPTSGGGTYDLRLGTLSVTSYEVVGWGGAGTFAQSGGSNVNSGALEVGDATDSSGLYNLSGGLLSSGVETIGRFGTGTFTQSGGTNTLVGGQPLDIGALNKGSYSLSGTGSLSVTGGVYVGGTSSGAGDTGSLSVTGGQMTVGTLEVWNSAGTEVSISGGTVSAGNTVNLATINVTGGSANLGAVTGTGTLNVGDASASVTASGLQQSSVTITSTGDMTLTAGGATNAVNSLVVDTGGVFNLTSTKLIINHGANPDPVATIRGYLASGYNNGAWNGPGIDSSSSAANHNYAIGYADFADPNNPAGLSSNQIEIKYTLYGDTNLDGTVNSIDFGSLAANFGKSGKVWDQGDFDYNGTVNSIDFGLLAGNFGKSVGSNGDVATAADWAALDAFAAANGLMADVPEPTFLGLSVLAGIGVLARRRRK